MTFQEACVLMYDKHKKLRFIKCVEYDTLFVFQAVSNKLDPSVSPDKVFDCMFSVNKKTKEIRAFLPFDIPLDEYQRGKVIHVFKN